MLSTKETHQLLEQIEQILLSTAITRLMLLVPEERQPKSDASDPSGDIKIFQPRAFI